MLTFFTDAVIPWITADVCDGTLVPIQCARLLSPVGPIRTDQHRSRLRVRTLSSANMMHGDSIRYRQDTVSRISAASTDAASVEKVLGGTVDVDSESHPPRMAAASTGPAYAPRWRAARRHVLGREDLPGKEAQVSREMGSEPGPSRGVLRAGLRKSLEIPKRSQKNVVERPSAAARRLEWLVAHKPCNINTLRLCTKWQIPPEDA